MNDKVTGYMCMIDFECELGSAKGGSRVYASVEDLKESHSCWESCGIVEVEVSFVKIIVDQDFSKDDYVERL